MQLQSSVQGACSIPQHYTCTSYNHDSPCAAAEAPLKTHSSQLEPEAISACCECGEWQKARRQCRQLQIGLRTCEVRREGMEVV